MPVKFIPKRGIETQHLIGWHPDYLVLMDGSDELW
jgi:hypothetical protein